MDHSDEAKKLHEILSQRNYGCRIDIVNATPIGWGVDITGVGIVFHSRDGTQDTVKDYPCNIPGNDNMKSYYPPDDNKCMGRIEIALRIQVEGENDPRLKTMDVPMKPGKCCGVLEAGIKPASHVAESGQRSVREVEVFTR